jgi:cell wall-associated NlpC family hydrolase
MKKSKHLVGIISGILLLFLVSFVVIQAAIRQETVLQTLAQVFTHDESNNNPSLQLNWYLPPTAAISSPVNPQSGGTMSVVELARKQIGKIYVWGTPSRNWASDGASPPNFDCSGLVGWAWYTATGGKVNMSGQTSTDWNDSSGKYQKFMASDIAKILPGDLVYFTVGNIHHVGIYSGSSCGAAHCFIEAPSSGKPVRETSLDARNAGKDPMIGFLRPITK